MQARNTKPSASPADFFPARSMALMLGISRGRLDAWHKAPGDVGPPPCVVDDGEVFYPIKAFRQWCASIPVIDGLPRMIMPPAIIAPGRFGASGFGRVRRCRNGGALA